MRRTGWVLGWMMAGWMSGYGIAQDRCVDAGFDDGGAALESVRGKATIELGGHVSVLVDAARIDARTATGERVRYHTTNFGAGDADLTFKVTPAGSVPGFLTMTLDLDDAQFNDVDGQLDQDDFLKELYFTFDDLCGGGFGVKVGKMRLPFGYDKDVLLLAPYMDDAYNSEFTWIPYDVNEGQVDLGGAWAPFGNYAGPTKVEKVFALVPYYALGDTLLVEAALYQRAASRGVGLRRRTDDNVLFKSMALAFTWTPCENLLFKASGLTEYIDSGKNAGPGMTDRAYGVSAAVDYTFALCGREINAFAEYRHGWHGFDLGMLGVAGLRGFDKGASADNVHFGTALRLNDRWTWHAQGEWLRQKRGDASGIRDRQTAWRAITSVQYAMTSGMVLEGGWQHEWLTVRAPGAAKRRYDVNTVYAGVRYSF